MDGYVENHLNRVTLAMNHLLAIRQKFPENQAKVSKIVTKDQ